MPYGYDYDPTLDGSNSNPWDLSYDPPPETGDWDYDPATDTYYRPDGNYSGGGTYPGGGTIPTFTATGTGFGDITPWEDPHRYDLDLPDIPEITGGGGGTPDLTGGMNFSPIGQPQGLEQWAPIRTPRVGPTGNPNPIGDPTAPPPGSPSTTKNSLTNNFSQSNTGISSQTNSMPPIAEGSPEGNPQGFTPQTLPQSQRQMNPAGMDSARHSPYFGPPPPEQSPYEPGLSQSGNQVPLGGGKTMPTDAPNNTDVSRPSWKGQLADGLLGLTGVNRYRNLIRNTRKRPGDKDQAKSPYDSGTF